MKSKELRSGQSVSISCVDNLHEADVITSDGTGVDFTAEVGPHKEPGILCTCKLYFVSIMHHNTEFLHCTLSVPQCINRSCLFFVGLLPRQLKIEVHRSSPNW